MFGRATTILLVFICASLMPLSTTFVNSVAAEPVQVCCDTASSVDLYLVEGASGDLTPFSQKLDSESSSVAISNSITSEEQIGTWSMGKVWPGEVPESTWSFAIHYKVSDAGGAQVNATATVKIGSLSFSASTDIGSTVLPQGDGVLNFDIPIDSTSLSASSDIELSLTARTIVFSVPESGAKLEFLWGSSDHESKISAEIPLLDLTIEDPIIDGSDIYLPVKIDSPFGLDTLAYSSSIELRVNNILISGNPVETQSGDSIIITWTWQGAAGGEETIQVSIRVSLQSSGPLLSGQSDFLVETFDGGGGTGTFYPQDEPLRTSGVGSPLAVEQIVELSISKGKLKLSRLTTLEIDGEMAFWMRWGMDHIGDVNIAPNSVLRGWNPGSITDEERVSKNIESVELEQFQREMANRYRTYMTDINGMQIDSGELIGDQSDFDTISISVDLMGETSVVYHPLKLQFSTLQTIDEDTNFVLMRTFTSSSSDTIWQDYSLKIEATSSGMTSFAGAELLESEDLIFKHSRMPWGEKITVEGDSISPSEDFTITIQPTNSIFYGPTTLIALTGVIFLLGLLFCLRITRNRHRRFLMFELVLIPLVMLIYYFSYPPVFIGGAAITVVSLWFITCLVSPRRHLESPAAATPVENTLPTIGCPACQTVNLVTSDIRPLRIACTGCSRTIKIVG
ncbi:MAG: hypothetical protein CBC92_003600 [Euryarchaeota archaeon TMED132]|nr:hypothetical protein [Euryarchaeota archaeon]RAH06499.1 MAG: hypothetical protein CBC92_003600 [Euryarchaeota archaeon TMED132]|tara:strand:- start:11078 stop:13120 length:2043 start_codon:yes stop_codon:yes gene_type:complete